MSHVLVSLGWVLLFVAAGLAIGRWELEAFVAALLAGAAFIVARKLETKEVQ